jgi:GT2 family glycosyltransferase
LQIVVVDGGSDDYTLQQAAAADVVVVEPLEKRKTIARARNVGAALTSGPLLLHTDADVLFPDLSALLRDVHAVFENPHVVAATTEIRAYPWEARPSDRVAHFLANRLIRLLMPWGILARGECQIVRRSAFEAIGGYDDKIVLGEDSDLFRRLARTGQTVFLPHHYVLHSPRRFQAVGYLNWLRINLLEALSQLFRRRSSLTEWEVIR